MEDGFSVYGKPNMAALEGEWGRQIINAIKATPKTDFSSSEKKCRELEARIRDAKSNGTF